MLTKAAHLRERGDVPEAIAAYRALLSEFPELPESWYNLGYLLRHQGAAEEAISAYETALSGGVSGPEEVYLNIAAIYADQLQAPRKALDALEAALRLKPDYLPAVLNLGNLSEDIGEREAAKAAYERALVIAPNNALALARLAGLARANSMDDPMIARLKAAIATHAHPPADAAHLWYALGRLYDTAGAFDLAYEAIERANGHSEIAAGGFKKPYNVGAEAIRTDVLARLYEQAGRPRDGIEAPSPAPIFILGMFRSGSTLLEQVLGGHPAVAAGGEFDMIPRIARGLGGDPQSQAAAPTGLIREYAQAYLTRTRSLFPDARIVTDKRPDNFWHVGLIKRLFPTAKIINTVRNPLDNLISIWSLYLDASMAYNYRIENIAGAILVERRMMAHWHHLYPGEILEVSYERLIAEPEAQIRRILDYAGLPWDPACLRFHESRGPVRTASVWQVREPLHDRAIGRWRHYERHLRARPQTRWLQMLLDGEPQPS